MCDVACNTSQCAWDGMDCHETNTSAYVHGTLIIHIAVTNTDFKERRNGFLIGLGRMLHGVVKVARDNKLNEMIYTKDLDPFKEHNQRSSRSSQSG